MGYQGPEELRAINITGSSSGKGLREQLLSEAANRGMKITPLVSTIYVYAVSNNDLFSTPLRNAMKKDGEHIGAKVPETVAKALQKWATSTNRSRGYLCCYILEKVLEDNLLDKILTESNLPNRT